MVAPLLVLMLLVFVVPQATYTQVLYGSLTGNVTDQKGAAVPGVKVEARNVGTGASKGHNHRRRMVATSSVAFSPASTT